MSKETFIDFLQRSSPNEVRQYLQRNGKTKGICPIIQHPIPKKGEKK